MHMALKIDPADYQEFLLTSSSDKLPEDMEEMCQDSSAPSASKKLKKQPAVLKWKDVHFDVFRVTNMEWPPLLEELNHVINYRDMHERVKEIAFFLQTVYSNCDTFPIGTAQFVDANNSLERILHWDDDKDEPTVTNPWSVFCPTLTTMSKILMRELFPDNVVKIRLLSPEELMLLIGFPRSRVDELKPFSGRTLSSLAGNTFSGFSLLDVLSSVFYAAGRAGITGEMEQEVGPDPEVGDGSSQEEEPRNASSSSSD